MKEHRRAQGRLSVKQTNGTVAKNMTKTKKIRETRKANKTCFGQKWHQLIDMQQHVSGSKQENTWSPLSSVSAAITKGRRRLNMKSLLLIVVAVPRITTSPTKGQ